MASILGRLSHPRGRAALARIVVVILLIELSLGFLAVGSYRTLTGTGHLNRAGNPIGADFVQYYAVSVLAREGEPAAPYDLSRLHEVEEAVIGAEVGEWPWYYPPTFMLALLPLSLVPYLGALSLWLLLGVGAYLWVVHRIAPHPAAPLAALLFPAAQQVVFSGQNGCLSAALLGGALVMLERRPVLAGVLLGLLSYKPHLGLLLPVALAAGGHWRSFAAATATTLAFAAVSALALGLDPWLAFVDSISAARTAVEAGESPWFKMISVFAAVRLAGGGVVLAWVLQGLSTAAAVAAVAWTWRRPIPLATRASVLVFAIPLSTPYVQFYDLAMLALAIAWLVWRARETAWLGGERPALAALWIAPVAAWIVAQQTGIPLWPLILAGMLALALRRARGDGATAAVADMGSPEPGGARR